MKVLYKPFNVYILKVIFTHECIATYKQQPVRMAPPFEPRRMEIQSYPLSTDPASW